MLAISWRNLWEHKLRTLLLGGAIVVGVAFVVASFILTDSIGRAFDGVFTEALADVDIQVTPDPDEIAGTGFDIPRLPGDLADDIAAVEGVATAEAGLQDFVIIDDPDGDGGGFGFGPPSFGISWPEGPSPFRLADGAPPTDDGHVVLDIDTLADRDLAIGDEVRIAGTDGRFEDFEVVGTLSFGDTNTLLGVSFVAFSFDRAEGFFDAEGEASGYTVTTDAGVDVDAVVDELNNEVLPPEAVAANAQTTAEQQSADLAEGLGFLTTFLLVFAAISLVVGGFVVYNAFQVVLAQRTRELGLLRVLGAARRNILSMVVIEAAWLGLAMSVVGIPVGYGVAWAARAALDAFAGGVPTGDLVVEPRTAIVAVGVGTSVAVLSALLPALRANQVSPMAALRDQPELATPRRWVAAVGAVISIMAIGLLGWAAISAREGSVFVGDNDALITAGIGAFALFAGLVLSSRALARPVIGVLGSPVGTLTGRLARENARRSPARTATTATALMIGVGLVVMVAILITSLQDTIDDAISESFRGDLIVGPAGFNPFSGISPDVGDIVEDVDGVATVARTNLVLAEFADGQEGFLVGAEPETIELVVAFEDVEGSFDDLVGDTVAVQRIEAEASGLALGDTVPITVEGEVVDYEVAAIWDLAGEASDGQSFYTNYEALAARVPDLNDSQLIVAVAEGADVESVQADVESALGEFANVQVQSLADLSGQVEAGLGGVQVFLTVLLLASVFVALFGIVLTLYLSVFERTREIGLLRAVGMTRDQLGSTIRWEAILIALFGAVLGLVLGLAGGWALTAALVGEGATLAVPWVWIAGSLVGGAVAGFFASIIPAASAARMDVLEAIAYE